LDLAARSEVLADLAFVGAGGGGVNG
jgi:hypothetical protein